MRNRINNILIGLLWLLAATLGANFWFNTLFGFNIFSLQHWQYLAYMQASGQPVRTSFYVSFLLIIIITVSVLYKLLHKPVYKTISPVFDTAVKPSELPVTPISKSQETKVTTPPATTTPGAYTPAMQTNNMPGSLVRPPRLNVPLSATYSDRPTTMQTPSTNGFNKPRQEPNQDYEAIREIFTSAGFVDKGAPRIKNVQTAIIAIGNDELLWLGAQGIKTTDMKIAIDTLTGVFADTLEDIEIHIKAFIINAPDALENTDDSILQFATIDDLRSFIMENPNTPPDEDEAENFDAYSAYIGTVVDYIRKI